MQKLPTRKFHRVSFEMVCWQRMLAPAMRINVDFQIEIVPADGIRLPFFLRTVTSEGRRFLGST
jgi:hypothetical protein